MADLLQITTPMLPRGYNAPSVELPPDQTFQLANTTQVISSHERSSQEYHNDDASDGTLLRGLELNVAQNPTSGSDSLSAILSDEVLAALRTGGGVNLLEELTSLANEIMLGNSEQLAADFVSQEGNSTLFQGEVFDMLRNLLAKSDSMLGGGEVRSSIANLLKSTAAATSNDNILQSLSDTLKFLSEELYPSRSISESLKNLSDALRQPDAAENFPELRSQISELLKDVSGSILLTDDMKNLLPLITYNMSRFNDNPTMLADSLNKLLDSIVLPDGAEAEALKSQLSSAFKEFVAGSDAFPDEVKTALLGNNASSSLGEAVKSVISQLLSNADAMPDADAVREGLSDISSQKGLFSLRQTLSFVLPDSAMESLDTILGGFSQSHDLNSLLGQLSDIINAIPDEETKMVIAQKLNEVLSDILENTDVKYDKPTAMEKFTNFLLKNLDDNALNSISEFNKQDVMSSLLTSPGVFTPLMHFLAPLEIEDENGQKQRAFGELWVDSDDESSTGGSGGGTHILLDFSVENVGDFELEMFAANGNELTVNLMCPKSMSSSYSHFKTAIARLAAGKGYSVKSSKVGTLTKKRNLSQVFPKLTERRSGLNVSI